MWHKERIIEYLRDNLKTKRYLHSLGVSECAVKLAEKYGASKEKAEIAGLVHDCAKYMSGEDILKIMRETGDEIDQVSLNAPDIMHGRASAYIAKTLMEIEDDEILEAVRYHTTGKENMTVLEKIIYLADYIEPNRSFPEVDRLREVAFRDLDEALIMAFNNTIKFVIEKDQMLHLNTIKARNYLIEFTARN